MMAQIEKQIIIKKVNNNRNYGVHILKYIQFFLQSRMLIVIDETKKQKIFKLRMNSLKCQHSMD